MTLAHALERTETGSPAPASRSARRPLGRLTPRATSKPARRRFRRDRIELYLSRLSGPPTDAQAAMIESLIELEWNAIVAEHAGGLLAMREGRENRRLFMRLLGDFERSLAAPAEPPGAALDRHLALLAAKSGGAR